LIEWLINRARSFIYSTAPPPATVAAALAGVNFLLSSEGEERRLRLWKRIRLTRELLLSLDAQGHIRRNPGEGGSTLNEDSGSAIFPWTVGDEQAALDLAAALMNEGFLVPAIRYPTVAKGSARLRITVTAAHNEGQIRALCDAIKRKQRFDLSR
jgi:7-keto-8-aminopelargonate synthetase-like enzyme